MQDQINRGENSGGFASVCVEDEVRLSYRRIWALWRKPNDCKRLAVKRKWLILWQRRSLVSELVETWDISINDMNILKRK